MTHCKLCPECSNEMEWRKFYYYCPQCNITQFPYSYKAVMGIAIVAFFIIVTAIIQ